ncbi:lasso peptide biosynthesis PqqD family chaperone [Streptomyces sp. LZ34]
MTPITLRPQVTCVTTPEGMVLLDERSGRYWQLNATGALILRHLLRGETPRQAAAALARRHPAAAARATGDVDQLLSMLRERRLLAEPPDSRTPAPAPGPKLPAPGRITPAHRVLAMLCTAAAGPLSRARPRRIRAVLCLLRRGAAPASPEQTAAARHAVVTVSARCAAARSCLHRSLATTLLCRALGVWPTWCTGVRTDPFGAHAWVAVDGVPIGEPAHERGYTPVITVPPCS